VFSLPVTRLRLRLRLRLKLRLRLAALALSLAVGADVFTTVSRRVIDFRANRLQLTLLYAVHSSVFMATKTEGRAQSAERRAS
jgi:hypothetical protein